jgi:hypothetical protein
VLAAGWAAYVAAVYRRGSADGDSLMYHLPFATRFVQTGSTTGLDTLGPDPWVPYYPANVELVEATVMLPVHHEAFVPLLNLGWLALALLAGWCIGRRHGRAPIGLLGVAVVMAVPFMGATQGGTARVDAAVVALVVAAAALLLEEPRTTASVVTAGLAVGLAMGSKLIVLPLGGALLLAVGVLVWRRDGGRRAAAWAGAIAAAGASWYVRNLVATGSPLPVVDLRLGPVGFRALDDPRLDVLDDAAVVDQLGRPGIWGRTFGPAVEAVVGPPPVVAALVVTIVATVVLLVRRRPVGMVHALGLAAVVGCLAYPFSPNTAPVRADFGLVGSADELIVALNARYVLPAAGLLLSLLAVGLAGRRGRRAAPVVATVAAAYVVAQAMWRNPGGEWPLMAADRWVGAAVALAATAAGLAAHAWTARRPPPPAVEGTGPGEGADAGVSDRRLVGRRRGLAAAGVAVAAALVVAGGWDVVQQERLDRYLTAPDPLENLWWAARGPQDDDLALVGDWVQHPYVGSDLADTVRYLAVPDGDLDRPPETCAELRRALRAGEFDVAVVQRPLLDDPSATDAATAWLAAIPGADLAFRNEEGAVVRLPDPVPPPTGECT